MKKLLSKINSFILSFKMQHLLFMIFFGQIFIGVAVLLVGSQLEPRLYNLNSAAWDIAGTNADISTQLDDIDTDLKAIESNLTSVNSSIYDVTKELDSIETAIKYK